MKRIHCYHWQYTCTNHCTKPSHILWHFIYWFLTFSDIDFLVTSGENRRTLFEFKLSKANWAASLYCAAITCHTSPRARVCLVLVACLGQLASRGESWTIRFFISCVYRIAARIDAESPCFHPQFGQFPYFIHCRQAYCLFFNALSNP